MNLSPENQALVDKQEQAIQNIMQGTFEDRRAFLEQFPYFTDMPLDDFFYIHSQKPEARMVHTFDEWKAQGFYVAKGNKSIQVVKANERGYAKRVSYFDVSQLSGNLRMPIKKENPLVLARSLSLLDNQVATIQDSHEQLAQYVTGVANYGYQHSNVSKYLNRNELDLANLLARYTLEVKLGMATQASLQAVEEKMRTTTSRLHFLNAVQYAENICTHISQQLHEVKEQVVRAITNNQDLQASQIHTQTNEQFAQQVYVPFEEVENDDLHEKTPQDLLAFVKEQGLRIGERIKPQVPVVDFEQLEVENSPLSFQELVQLSANAKAEFQRKTQVLFMNHPELEQMYAGAGLTVRAFHELDEDQQGQATNWLSDEQPDKTEVFYLNENMSRVYRSLSEALIEWYTDLDLSSGFAEEILEGGTIYDLDRNSYNIQGIESMLRLAVEEGILTEDEIKQVTEVQEVVVSPKQEGMFGKNEVGSLVETENVRETGTTLPSSVENSGSTLEENTNVEDKETNIDLQGIEELLERAVQAGVFGAEEVQATGVKIETEGNKKRGTLGYSGSLQEKPEGTALPDEENRRSFIHSSFLHFSTENVEMTRGRTGYHVATRSEIERLNKFGNVLHESGKFYKERLADKKIHYIYQGKNGLAILPVTFGAENFAHLTGLWFDGKNAKEFLEAVVNGVGNQKGILLKNDQRTFDKLEVLDRLEKIIDVDSFTLNELTEVKQAQRMNFSDAIQTDDKELLLAIREIEPEVHVPISLLNLTSSRATTAYENVPQNTILGIVSESHEGDLELISVNEKKFSNVLEVANFTAEVIHELSSVSKEGELQKEFHAINDQSDLLEISENQEEKEDYFPTIFNQEDEEIPQYIVSDNRFFELTDKSTFGNEGRIGMWYADRHYSLNDVKKELSGMASQNGRYTQWRIATEEEIQLLHTLYEEKEQVQETVQEEILYAFSAEEIEATLSIEGDLVLVSEDDTYARYENSFMLDDEGNRQLHLLVYSSNGVLDNLEEGTPCPWSLSYEENGDIKGVLAHGSDWVNEFSVKEEIEQLLTTNDLDKLYDFFVVTDGIEKKLIDFEQERYEEKERLQAAIKEELYERMGVQEPEYRLDVDENELSLNHVQFGGVLNTTVARAFFEDGRMVIDPQFAKNVNVHAAKPFLQPWKEAIDAINIQYFDKEVEIRNDLVRELGTEQEVEQRGNHEELGKTLEEGDSVIATDYLRSMSVNVMDMDNQTLDTAQNISLFDDLEGIPSPQEAREHLREMIEDLDAQDVGSHLPLDFIFPENTENFYPRLPSEKLEANLQAIRLLKDLEIEEEEASAEQQEILAQYVGWGGLANQVLDPRRPRYAKEREELKEMLSEKEYKQVETSSLTAYYTDPELIKAMWAKLEEAGFSGGRVLDPAMGTGNFFSAMPAHLREKSELVGVELDSLTGAIAQQLHQSADVRIQGFETTDFNDHSFDLVVGNVPFADIRLSDDQYKDVLIHDYFFQKSLDLVREGGVVAFITSTGTMDKKDSRIRQAMSEKAKLVGGFRLPNTAFKDIAGTDVTSDVLFFQKKTQLEIEREEMHSIQTVNWVKGSPNDRQPNPYFTENSANVLGKLEVKNFRGQTLVVVEDKEQAPFLERFVQAELPLNYQVGSLMKMKKETVVLPQIMQVNVIEPWDETIRAHSLVEKDGKVYYHNGEGMELVDGTYGKGVYVGRVAAMAQLRETALAVVAIQKDEDFDKNAYEELRIKLNEQYDKLTKAHGAIHSKGLKLAFQKDDYYPFLSSLEIEHKETDENGEDFVWYEKAPIFERPTIRPEKIVEQTDNALDALHLSYNNFQKVDLDYMQSIYPKEVDEIIDELGKEIFHNPQTNEWELASAYLSGDVKTKLEEIREEVGEGNVRYLSNQEALEEVQPVDLSITEINFTIGTPWVPHEMYEDFLSEVFELSEWEINHSIKLEHNEYEKKFTLNGKSYVSNHLIRQTYGTSKMNGLDIMEASLNFTPIKITKTVPSDSEFSREKRVTDPKETMLAREKQERLKLDFKNWIFNSPERVEELESIYNKQYNRILSRNYDGSHMEFPSLASHIELRPHQKDAIARVVSEGRGLLAHVVGAGKTLTMIGAGMKMKELGMVNKPLYVVPRNLVTNFGDEVLRAYPDKRVLIADSESFKMENRHHFISKLATQDYDAIIMGMTQFEKIKMSDEKVQEFYEKEISIIEEMLLNAGSGSSSYKQLQQSLKKQEKNLEEALKVSGKDRQFEFEDLGVDFLFVDEAHNYKNLQFHTKMSGVAGVNSGDAKRSMDMLLKVRHIQEKQGNRGVVFATGTPVSNSMCEMYTMMRYLQPDVLKNLGIEHFDNWQGVFGEIENKMEMTPEGSGFRIRDRFSKFHNLPELMTQFKLVADIQTQDMLDLPVPNVETVTVETQATPAQKLKMEELANRAEAVRNSQVEPTEDNMLKITHEARYMALDPRLLDQAMYVSGDSKKIQACVENVAKIHEETKESRSTQIIFSDIGVPNSEGGKFSAYEEIKGSLLEKGIPEKEIAFIHDAKTDKQKDALFQKVRNGSVRIILGSTQKLGTGVNVQDKLIAAHHLDCPWRPSDIEQRNGRIVRQGNENSEVSIYTYVTKGTFDSYLWQIQEQKLTYIQQVMSSKSASRNIEEMDEVVLQASEVKALALGNPLLKERADLENSVHRLRLLQNNHINEQKAMVRDLSFSQKALPEEKVKLTTIQSDKVMYENLTPNVFEITLDGKTYTAEDKKTDVGQQLLKVITETRMSSSNIQTIREMKFGEYKGFNLYFDGFVQDMAGGYSNISLRLEGANNYLVQINPQSPLSSIQKVTKFGERLEQELLACQKKITDYETRIEQIQAQMNKPFEKEQELSEKSLYLKKLDQAIELGVSLEEVEQLNESVEEEQLSSERVQTPKEKKNSEYVNVEDYIL